MTVENSEIASFYKGKNVFLTGGTGFVGKLVGEQLLRKCDLNKLYLLIRPKRGEDPKKRFENLFQDAAFERVLKEKPDCLDKVELLCGDMSADNLGLSEASLAAITDNVNIVIHGAATVRFDESLKVATNINIKGTITITKLCHKIKNLIAYTYISTAFSNCPFKEIKEEFYETPIDCNEIIKIVEQISDVDCEILLEKILGKWPNTYALSKAVAENAVKEYAKEIPTCVFRPAIIVSTIMEPVAGWIDNIYGPIGVAAGVAMGVLRVVQADPKGTANLVPADYVASSIIAASRRTGENWTKGDIPVYNYVPSKDNCITWQDYRNNIMELGETIPIVKSVWLYSCTFQKSRFVFAIFTFFLHFLPALLADIVLFCSNKKTGILKLYRKGSKLLEIITYFGMRSWTFRDENVHKLFDELNEVDKNLFFFDLRIADWKAFFQVAVPGARIYITKEGPETIAEGKRIMRRRQIIQRIVFSIICGLIAYKCLSLFNILS